MNDRDLPADVRELIRAIVPSIDALELLVLLARHPGKRWTVATLTEAMVPTVIPEPAMWDYLAGFRSHGVLREEDGSLVHELPSGPAREALAGLLTAHNERPVTLIRVVYAIADAKRIQAFADAFKLKKDQ